ncbi:LPS export ABC transporter permease LptG [Paracoccus sp. p4-l81]|uniref:LPS export ABC transporter permease LptG n=1 Tax=unclassified Paracoccus (in: a-proteobacteria) TaxID=2688777 RepID=UPI0035BAE833
MILGLYLARRFLRSLAIVTGVFLAILYLIDMVEQIRRFSGGQVGFWDSARLAALNLPGAIQTILPLIVLLAAVAMFLMLARSSELVAIRASGRSALRMLAAPVTVAALVGALAVAVLNPLVAATSKRYQTLADGFGGGGATAVSVGPAIWLRQGDAEGTAGGQTVIRADRASLDGATLHGVTFMIFAPEAGPVRRLDADTATLTDQGWQLARVKDWPLDTANPDTAATAHDRLTLPSTLTPERIRDGVGTPSAVSFWHLPAFIAELERAGFSARRHSLWFQMELALPAMLAGMVLIAAGFTMRPARFGRSGLMVMLALAAGLGLFFLRNFAQALGDNGQIPITLAAAAPPAVAVLFALGLLLHLEDG